MRRGLQEVRFVPLARWLYDRGLFTLVHYFVIFPKRKIDKISRWGIKNIIVRLIGVVSSDSLVRGRQICKHGGQPMQPLYLEKMRWHHSIVF